MLRVSTIIPAYNSESTILEAIQSVQKQTYSDHEIIIINDGSTDKTLEVLDSIKDERLKILSYENAGAAAARNRGISCAEGDLIAFLDADDLWTPDKLEAQVEALERRPDAGVVYSWTYFMDEKEDGSYIINPCEPVFHEQNVLGDLLVNNFIASGSNIMIRRHVIEQVGLFDPSLKNVADWDYSLRLAAHYPFALVPKHQIYYRRASNSLSSNAESMRKACLLVLNRAYQNAPQDLQNLQSASLAWVYRYCTDVCLRNSSDIYGVQQGGWYLLQAILREPKALLERHTQSLIRWFFKRWILLKFFSQNY